MLLLGAEFVGNVVVITALFMVICGAAVVLEKFANYIQTQKLLPDWMVSCVRGLAAGLFVLDVVMFVCLVGYHAIVFLGELFQHLLVWWTTPKSPQST